MKINWGTGITIAIMLFMSFILYFVLKVQSDQTYDNELVVEEYYKQELVFQSQLDKKQRAQNLSEKVKIYATNQGIEVQFPSEFDSQKIQGKISLYRPSNQKLDFEKEIIVASSKLFIPKQQLVDGRWDITIDWSYDTVEYINTETLIVN